jgi:hypothetical protein
VTACATFNREVSPAFPAVSVALAVRAAAHQSLSRGENVDLRGPHSATVEGMADTSPAVGHLLRQLRTERGQSLRGAARDLGVDPSYLSKVERGQKPLPEALKRAVGDYYDADPDELDVASGEFPADIARILAEHPEAIEELRKRYG